MPHAAQSNSQARSVSLRSAQIVALISEIPAGEEQEMAFSYFQEHLDSLQEKTLAETGEDMSLAGLWKVTSARQQRGNIPLNASMDCGSIDDVVAVVDEIEEDVSWSVEEELLYFLEIHEDGTYKEVDLTQGPLTATNELESMMAYYTDADDLEAFRREMGLSQAGLVSALAGYEHSFKTDVDGYAKPPGKIKVSQEIELVLHEYHDDEWVQDFVELESPTTLKRRGFVLWDGVYTNKLSLEYTLVARFDD